MKKSGAEEFLGKLLACASPSGFEDEAHVLFREYLAPFAGRTWGDVIGNAYAVVNEGAPTKVMVTGHADEIGMQVTHIDDNGFLRFRASAAPVRGVDRRRGQCSVPTAGAGRRQAGSPGPRPPTREPAVLWSGHRREGPGVRREAGQVGDYAVSRPNSRFLAGAGFVSRRRRQIGVTWPPGAAGGAAAETEGRRLRSRSRAGNPAPWRARGREASARASVRRGRLGREQRRTRSPSAADQARQRSASSESRQHAGSSTG